MSADIRRRCIRMLTLAAASGMVVACASIEAPDAIPATSAPMPVANYDWHYNSGGGEASLVFGMAESDDVMMGMSCAAGSGRLDIFAVVDQAREIHLESGGDTERFPAVAEPSELHDGHVLTASADADMPVFKRFRRVGWMASLHDGRRDLYVAHPENALMIDVFFQTCG